MRCDDFLPLIEKLADGEATAAERQEAEAHLKSCSACESHLQFLQALPQAARRASLPDPPEMYWDVLPRKIMSRIEKEGGKERGGRRDWFSRWLAPSRLRWVGAMAAALVAAVVGLRVLEFPLADPTALPSAAVTRPGEDGLAAGISERKTPARAEVVMEKEPDSFRLEASKEGEAQKETAEPEGIVTLDDESLEFAARQRRASESPPLGAPEVVQEEITTGALSAPGKAGRKNEDNAGEFTDQPVMGGRLEGETDELKSMEPDKQNRDERSTKSRMLAETANAPQAEAPDVKEPKPAATEAAADRDPPAQPVAVSRALRAPALKKASPNPEEQRYRDLAARYPARDGRARSSQVPVFAQEKVRDDLDAQLAPECADWRQFLSQYPESEWEADARHRLALCSITMFERSPSNANRRRALEEGALYLDVATDDTRAEAVRRAIARIQP